MKNLITKALGIAGITALSFLNNGCDSKGNIKLYSQNGTLLNKLHFIEYNNKNILIVPAPGLQNSTYYVDENKDYYFDYKFSALWGPKALPIKGPKQKISNDEIESLYLFTKSNSNRFILNKEEEFIELK